MLSCGRSVILRKPSRALAFSRSWISSNSYRDGSSSSVARPIVGSSLSPTSSAAAVRAHAPEELARSQQPSFHHHPRHHDDGYNVAAAAATFAVPAPEQVSGQCFRCPKCSNYLSMAADATGATDGTFFCSVCAIWVPATGQRASSSSSSASSSYHQDSVLQYKKIPTPPNGPSSPPPSSPPPSHPGGPLFPAAKPGMPSPGNTYPPGVPDDPFMTQHSSSSSSSSTVGVPTPDTNVPPQQQDPPPPSFRLLTPKQIFQGLDEYVIGQANVKIALAVGVHNHYKRLAVSRPSSTALQQQQQQQQQQQAAAFSSLQQDLAGDIDPTLLATPGMHIPPPPPPPNNSSSRHSSKRTPPIPPLCVVVAPAN